jgi:type IV secretory pathway TraG/TraD family ATPase VirD4
MPAPVRPSAFAGGAAAQWPWVIVILGGAVAAADSVVWLAFRLASLLTGQGWAGPGWAFGLSARAVEGGAAQVSPGSDPVLLWTLAVLLGVVALAAAVPPLIWMARHLLGRRDPARSMAKRHQLRDLTPAGAAVKAVRLRGSLAGTPPKAVPARECGLALGTLKPRGPLLRASWEDVLLAVMAPRAGKTTSLAVPSVLDAPGWAVATSNKADLWISTSRLRAARGEVWTFDPQSIVYAEQTWWWNPISVVKDVASAHRLAGHFVQEIRGERGDKDFWSAAALDLLTGLLLAAARGGRDITEVDHWLNDSGSPEPADILEASGDRASAASLRGRQRGASDTREGIYETARTAVQCLRDDSIMRWVTPPPRPAPMFDVERFVTTCDTLFLLSKDGAAAAAPLVAALTDAVMRAAVQAAERRGGRLDPPGVVVLDEAANVCRISDLPELYSHLGSRGVIPLTILQSYKQGVRVWGEHGMDALWSAATVKLIGAGTDDPKLAEDLSRLIGEEDVDILSTTHGRGHRSRQNSVRRQRILDTSDVRALPRGSAILLPTGVKAALVQLRPWFTGPNAQAISSAGAAAEAGLTLRAQRTRPDHAWLNRP